MDFMLLTAEMVEAIHDEVLNPGELTGRARDKSLESTLARVENHIAYGMVRDIFELAALYAMAVARGHCFNDANKRTAYRSMQVVLELNGRHAPRVSPDEIGPQIIALAQGAIDDGQLADWLRDRC
ncbi:MAG: type II toxin-antitoxin system death-on-curing family toxin [Paracoccus sp. (in: a-proteobacteria)]|nr:type II toxin-antitoxin system death-on-curing family toxin [Paracoccus sp. (in: a-proteobacteria)]